jgi:hypothetical protein
MPCACQIPGPAYPENKEWGPFVWSILHALAEKSGKVVFQLYEADERRAWVQILQLTGAMLPCSDCREHYKSWLSGHTVTSIQSIPYSELKVWVRTWIWELHQNVNSRLGKTGVDINSLPSLYGSVNISMDFKLFEMIEKRAIQQQGVHLNAWLAWVKQYRTLMSVYGLS